MNGGHCERRLSTASTPPATTNEAALRSSRTSATQAQSTALITTSSMWLGSLSSYFKKVIIALTGGPQSFCRLISDLTHSPLIQDRASDCDSTGVSCLRRETSAGNASLSPRESEKIGETAFRRESAETRSGATT